MSTEGGGGIANTQFGTGPKDDLATVDVYSATEATATNASGKTAGGFSPVGGVIPSVSNSSSAAGADPATKVDSAVAPETKKAYGPISEYAGANVKPEQRPETPPVEKSWLQKQIDTHLTKDKLSEKVKSELQGVKPSKVTPKKRLTGTGAKTAEALDKLEDKRVQKMLKKVDQDGQFNDVAVQVGEANYIVSTADVGSVSGGVDLLQSLGETDSIKFIDDQAKVEAFKEALDVAVEWNAPGIIDKLMEKANVRDKSFLLSALPTAVRVSNLDMVNEIISHQSIAKCVAYMPTMLVDLFRYFTVSRRLEQSKWQEHLDKAIAIADQIEEDWLTTEREGEQVRDLRVFISASDMAISLFNQREEYRSYSMIAGNYFNLPKYFIARQNYPKAPLSRL